VASLIARWIAARRGRPARGQERREADGLWRVAVLQGKTRGNPEPAQEASRARWSLRRICVSWGNGP